MTHPATLLRNSWKAYARAWRLWTALVAPIGLLLILYVASATLLNDAPWYAGLIFAVVSAAAAVVAIRLFLNAAIWTADKSLKGEKTTLREAYQVAIKTFWPSLGVAVLRALIVLGGLILLIVPGIIWAMRYSLATQLVVLEGKTGWDAMAKSKELTNGKIIEAIIDFGVASIVLGYGTWLALGAVLIVFLVLNNILANVINTALAASIIGGAATLVELAVVWFAIVFPSITSLAIYKDFSAK
jgi:hypothetical protein